MAMSSTAQATERTLTYLRGLIMEREWSSMYNAMPSNWRALFMSVVNGFAALDKNGLEPKHLHVHMALDEKPYLIQSDASKFITELNKCPKLEGTNVPKARPPVTEDGMYRHPSGTFYKVYHTVHGANQQVAKRLIIVEGSEELAGRQIPTVKVSFIYEGKAPLAKLSADDKLTLEQAREFGALYGTCCVCGRTLTNELSIHLGIGPKCGDREFGGEFKFLLERAKLEINA